MTESWDFYCDEAGQFEKLVNSRKQSILAGMLVPSDSRNELSLQYAALLKKNGINEGFVHGKDLWKSSSYKSFLNDLVKLTLHSPIKLCRTAFKKDRFDSSSKGISETFACNRYLYMIESLLEHLIFLDTDNFEISQSFSLHPNSRVFPCTKEESEVFRSNGFNVFQPDQSKPDQYLVKVWDETGLRVFLNRLRTDYAPFESMLGKRTVEAIEMPVAKKSDDSFVHWIDNLAGILMWQEGANKERLESSLYMDIRYGESNGLYKNLCSLYLQEDFNEFIHLYFQSVNIIKTQYYHDKLNTLISKSLEKFDIQSAAQAYQLEGIIDRHLRSGTGELGYVTDVVDYLIEALSRSGIDDKKLLFKLYNHKLSCHNHRGEALQAWQVAKRSEQLDYRPANIIEWREEVEFVNRKAVISANVFDFTSCNPRLEQILDALHQSRETLNRSTGSELSDPLIGKLSGTIAQNYAFLAPFQSDCFQKAERIFLKAKKEFERPSDTLRQNIYLVHLYMDQGLDEKVTETVRQIISDSDVERFIDAPCHQNARYMGFPLAVLFKWCLYRNANNDKFPVDTFTLENIRSWFQNASHEHPFEFIYAYLGRLAFRKGRFDEAAKWFDAALDVPARGDTSRQITIRMIHAEIIVWRAMEEFRSGSTDAAWDRVSRVSDILGEIGASGRYEPVLKTENGKGVSGWFAEGYNALLESLDRRIPFPDACSSFLRYFTFNYR